MQIFINSGVFCVELKFLQDFLFFERDHRRWVLQWFAEDERVVIRLKAALELWILSLTMLHSFCVVRETHFNQVIEKIITVYAHAYFNWRAFTRWHIT